MAMNHANPAESFEVLPLGVDRQVERSRSLFKSRDLQVVRLVLKAGEELAPHRVQGDITIQCLEGTLDITADGRPVRLDQGRMVYLPGQCVHGLTAIEDAAALVTIALLGSAHAAKPT